MKKPLSSRPVERLFPFVLRARILLVGRETLARSKSSLHFVLITTDLSEGSQREILSQFAYYPIVQRYTSAELETFFGVVGAKVVGFKKSGLAQSLYAELKEFRINKAKVRPRPEKGEQDSKGGALPRATAANDVEDGGEDDDSADD